MFGKEPHAEKNQNERPEAIQPKFKDVHGVQEKDDAQADKNHSPGWNLGGVDFLTHAKRLCQSKRIRSRLPN